MYLNRLFNFLTKNQIIQFSQVIYDPLIAKYGKKVRIIELSKFE